MGVEVSIRNELGEVLEWFPRSDAVADLVWAAHNRTDAGPANQIDEYGLTVFDQEQIPPLLDDAEKLLELVPNDNRRIAVSQLVEFFRKAVGRSDASLHFEGD